MKKTTKLNPAIIHIAAFLLPVMGLFAVYAVVGIRPFGENSILAIDMRNQYISFFAYLRDELLLGGQSWLYTFSKVLGGDMAGFSAYYLLSPFNLLLLFFPTKNLADGVLVMTLLKVGCAGLTMSLLLNRKSPGLACLLFSVPYALMDYVTAFQQNIMWLDGVILLPIIIIGIERMLEGKGPLCYVLALAMAIITCYYIGFILCLFSLLYFVVSFFCFAPRPADGWKKWQSWKPMGRFALGSLLAGGLSAVVLLPALMSLQGGKATFGLENLLEGSFATLADTASRYLPGTINMSMIFFGYPNIYCGMLAMLCCAMFLLNKQVERRRRVGAGILIVAIIASFCIGPLDRLWHGMNKPVGFLFRYSFLLSFVILYMGWQGLRNLRSGDVTKRLPFVVGAAAVVVLLVWRDEYTHITAGKVLFALGVAVAGALLLWCVAKRRRWHWPVLALLALMLADMGSSTLLALQKVEYYPYDYFHDYVRATKPVVDAVKNNDNSFHRMEIMFPFSDNDPMLLGYRGLSHFSSADKVFVREFMEKTGFSQGDVNAKYSDGSTVGMDNLLGVKYLLTRRQPMAKPYTATSEKNGITAWENSGALPLGYLVSGDALQPLEAEQRSNLFEVQNTMWRSLLATDTDLYRPAGTPEVATENLSVGDFYGEAIYNKVDPVAEGWVEYSLDVDSDDDLYVQFTTLNYRGAEVYVNGEKWEDDYLTGNRHGILALGSHQPGSQLKVRLLPKSSGELLIMDVWFAYENRVILNEMTQELASDAYRVESFTNSHFTGTVAGDDSGKNLLLLTIPYDKGWQATLDGARVETNMALGALTAIEVPAGEHRLELRYIPPGLWVGCAITAVSLAGLLLWMWMKRNKDMSKNNKKKSVLKAENTNTAPIED